MINSVSKSLEVVFFHRKPRAVGNYSIEFIFADVRNRLGNMIRPRVVVSKYESSGFINRFLNGIEARRSSGQVNHITGDVNYLGIFLSAENTVNTILDCVHLNSSKGFKYWVFKKFWLEIPERRARFLTAISESTKREILRHHHCDPDKIRVIPVAISPAFQYKPKEFNEDNPVILQIGTAPNKNIPLLIQAVKGLKCVLNIVGKKDESYEALLHENKIDYVYESNLTNEEILERYERCDIVALVSTYEGFGMPILEAQAVGRVVITSNVYSMPEVAGDSAVLVDPSKVEEIRDGILRLISDSEFRKDRIASGLENIKRFNADLIAHMYYDLYQEVAASNA